jgi:hypothetical protein
MGFADLYFSKLRIFSPHFLHPPSNELRYIVVIPAYCEPDLVASLNSLWKCIRPKGHVEVIIVINSPENASEEVRRINAVSAAKVEDWIKEHTDLSFKFLLMLKLNMPIKDAGVGLARKTGMDEALSRFNTLNCPEGIILSFDADCVCAKNYFTSIEDALRCHHTAKGFTIYFEHPVAGNDFPERIYRGIISYELHLRYITLFLRYAGFPYAFHTVGSCFGVKALAYALQGGMNKRKAGEDFYFLHKIIMSGEFIEINNTCVYPSPRISSRVPFGTGAAIVKYLASDKEVFLTYNPESFILLRDFFLQIPKFYKISREEIISIINSLAQPLLSFLGTIDAVNAIFEINANSRSVLNFTKRFFNWFDAFRVIKFMNYCSHNYFRQIPVSNAVKAYLYTVGITLPIKEVSDLEMLYLLREIERKQPFIIYHPQ